MPLGPRRPRAARRAGRLFKTCASAAARDRDEVAEPEADQLEAEVERGRMGASARAARLKARTRVSPRCAPCAARSRADAPARASTSASASAPRAAARSSNGRHGSARRHDSRRRPGGAAPRARRRLRLAPLHGPVPGQPSRPLDVAARQARAGGRQRGLDSLLREQLRDPRRRHRAEPDRLAARGNRRQQPPRRRAHEHEVRDARRLLERLQQRVLRLLVHPLGLGDHEHAPGSLERPQRHLADDLAFARRPRGSRARRVARPSFRSGCTPAITRRSASPGLRPPVREQRGRERARRRALACPGRPVNRYACERRSSLSAASSAIRARG